MSFILFGILVALIPLAWYAFLFWFGFKISQDFGSNIYYASLLTFQLGALIAVIGFFKAQKVANIPKNDNAADVRSVPTINQAKQTIFIGLMILFISVIVPEVTNILIYFTGNIGEQISSLLPPIFSGATLFPLFATPFGIALFIIGLFRYFKAKKQA